MLTHGDLACGDCGTTNPVGTNFCHGCGRRLVEENTRDEVRSPFAESASASRPRLVAVGRDGSDGPKYLLEGDQIDLGREEGGLRFEDPHLAPRHARIEARDGDYVVTPLDLRNGVYVRLLAPHALADGDHFLVGKQVLRFELVSETERNLRPAVEHGVALFGTPVKVPWARLRQMTPAGTCRDVYHLTRPELVIGREQGDIVFADDEFLSRRHALIALQAGHVTLQDLESSNGTYVRLRGAHVLSPGEMIRIGDELLRFELG